MKDIKKIQFYNPPTPQHEAVQKEKEAEETEKALVEKEIPIQEEIKREIEEVETIPTRIIVKEILFWVLLTIVVITYGVQFVKYISYITINNAEVQFTRNHPEFVAPVRSLYENAHRTTDQDLLKALKGD